MASHQAERPHLVSQGNLAPRRTGGGGQPSRGSGAGARAGPRPPSWLSCPQGAGLSSLTWQQGRPDGGRECEAQSPPFPLTCSCRSSARTCCKDSMVPLTRASTKERWRGSFSPGRVGAMRRPVPRPQCSVAGSGPTGHLPHHWHEGPSTAQQYPVPREEGLSQVSQLLATPLLRAWAHECIQALGGGRHRVGGESGSPPPNSP